MIHHKLNHAHVEWGRDGKEVEVRVAQFWDANSDMFMRLPFILRQVGSM
jgi:hypothetical protein